MCLILKGVLTAALRKGEGEPAGEESQREEKTPSSLVGDNFCNCTVQSRGIRNCISRPLPTPVTFYVLRTGFIQLNDPDEFR